MRALASLAGRLTRKTATPRAPGLEDLLDELAATTDPAARATILHKMAAQQTGTPARLLELVALSEAAIAASWTAARDLKADQRIKHNGHWWVISADPELSDLVRVPVSGGETIVLRPQNMVRCDAGLELDGEEWQDNGWWELSITRDRDRRAVLLEAIHEDWATLLFGADASAILLDVAETERAATAPPGPPTDPGDEGRFAEIRGLLAQAGGRLGAIAISASALATVALAPSYWVKFLAGMVLICVPLVMVARVCLQGRP